MIVTVSIFPPINQSIGKILKTTPVPNRIEVGGKGGGEVGLIGPNFVSKSLIFVKFTVVKRR